MKRNMKSVKRAVQKRARLSQRDHNVHTCDWCVGGKTFTRHLSARREIAEFTDESATPSKTTRQ